LGRESPCLKSFPNILPKINPKADPVPFVPAVKRGTISYSA
jgi:hypothetical protein